MPYTLNKEQSREIYYPAQGIHGPCCVSHYPTPHQSLVFATLISPFFVPRNILIYCFFIPCHVCFCHIFLGLCPIITSFQGHSVHSTHQVQSLPWKITPSLTLIDPFCNPITYITSHDQKYLLLPLPPPRLLKIQYKLNSCNLIHSNTQLI
jgi:hypothetical protein